MVRALPEELKKFQGLVDGGLRSYFPPAAPYTHRVRKAMEYSLFAGGKRIQPILCLLACKAVGGRMIKALLESYVLDKAADLGAMEVEGQCPAAFCHWGSAQPFLAPEKHVPMRPAAQWK